MKKIGIITLSANENFGNKLQNYALSEFINTRFDGYKCETIWVENAFLSNNIKSLLKMLRRKIALSPIKYKREKIFKKFDRNYIKYCNKKIIYKSDFKNILDRFDYFIVGSDQVWNYKFMNNYEVFLLSSVKKDRKISYAASFGVSNLPNSIFNEYKDKFCDFEKISVREDAGAEIINKLNSNLKPEVLVDPTLLLDKKEWENIISKPKNISKIGQKKYILNYFLGELSDERKKVIEEFARKHDAHIINLLDKNDPFYLSGPSDFLWLEKNAFLVCTDSFHSSVFSIIFNRPFVIFDREENIEKMSSRIDTLISKLKLSNRRYNGHEITKENLFHDYSAAYKILEDEKYKSFIFLKNALDIKDSEKNGI